MNEKAYRVLEYQKIKHALREEAASEMTKRIIDRLKPSVDVYAIKEMLAETTEAVDVIMKKGALPLGAFYDIGDPVSFASKGGALTMKQLLQVLYNLHAARGAQGFLKSDLPGIPILWGMAEVLFTDKGLEDSIDRCILSEDEMADSASTELARIRRSIGRQTEAIRSRMSSMLTGADNKTLLQDAIVTMREGRYVIPVKQEHRAKFPGIVHDQSSTGATLFIEPQAIVNMNNDLRELEIAEKREMARILAELSGQVGEASMGLLNNQELMLKLDYCFAKGKLSVKYKGTAAIVNEERRLNIRKGRHPLIDPKKVVPISVELGKSYDTLVITGPNTGGKTVTLKTVGLFALMTQSGLHIPAEDRTEMPIYRSVYADIGDEQSIEQSLSTFSSHMKNIVDIVDGAGMDVLILLDELGAGTDPTEGAALAISILDDLRRKGASTIATTHYNELKKYAIGTSGVENASMEFDIETLSPTYRLTIGTPGKSNAFEISGKLGLPESIIGRARTMLDRGDLQFEEVITTIEKDRRAAEDERDEAIALRLSMQKQKEELDRKLARMEEQKEKILGKAKEEARDMVREVKDFSDEIQKELRELEKCGDSTERNRRQEQARKKIREVTGKYRDEMIVDTNFTPIKVSELKLGDRVKLVNLDQKGNLISLPDDRGEVQVQVGLLKVTVKTSQIAKIEGGTSKKDPRKTRYGALYRSKLQNISTSINVRGSLLDDAVIDVDKYLDDAFIAGLTEVTVIHGRGEGVLRSGLHEMFRHHKHVAKYRKGSYNEGGDGVTIVSLK